MTQSAQQDKGAGAPKAEKKRLRDKTVTITLTLPKAVFGTCFFLFVLVWVFIFGIMLGRGHNPEEVVPELAKVMPAPSTPDAQPSSIDTPPQGNVNDVLQPRDLKYHDSLKGKDTATPRAATPPQTPPAPPKQTAAPASGKPQTTPAPKPAQAPPSAKPAAKPVAQPPVASSTASQDQTVYNYVYQVAAFNNSAGAETMRKKLQSGGLNAKVNESASNGTTWYRIMVSFKGKPEDTRKLRDQLAAYGINAIILRGKAPAK